MSAEYVYVTGENYSLVPVHFVTCTVILLYHIQLLKALSHHDGMEDDGVVTFLSQYKREAKMSQMYEHCYLCL